MSIKSKMFIFTVFRKECLQEHDSSVTGGHSFLKAWLLPDLNNNT